MKDKDTLVEFSVVPIGHSETDSIGQTVAKVVKRVKDSGLANETHSMGTVVEGGIDQCLDLVKECIGEALKEVPRVTASIRLDVRPGHPGRIEANVRSVEEKLRKETVAR